MAVPRQEVEAAEFTRHVDAGSVEVPMASLQSCSRIERNSGDSDPLF
jgi:hypothetical protein